MHTLARWRLASNRTRNRGREGGDYRHILELGNAFDNFANSASVTWGDFEKEPLQLGQSLQIRQALEGQFCPPHSNRPFAGERHAYPHTRPSHHQQQTQRTFHFQLVRLAYPEATNIEAGGLYVCGLWIR